MARVVFPVPCGLPLPSPAVSRCAARFQPAIVMEAKIGSDKRDLVFHFPKTPEPGLGWDGR
jgi:hypothetical protein